MKTNTWIKRSANNVMWTLFVVVFCLIHTLQRFLIASVQSELNLKYECCWKQRSIIKANLHLLYLSVCTRLLVLYVVWLNVLVCACVCVCEVKICARARDYSGGISALCFFSIQYTFVVDLFGFFFFFFSFCLSKIYSDVNCY